MSKKAVFFDVVLLVVWIAILLFELFFTQDIIFTIIAIVCLFVFAALLGRDVRRVQRKPAS